MTVRLYYDDSLLTEFDAVVTNLREENGKWLCTLDRSAFYPTSGGQPYDTGSIVTQDGERLNVTQVECASDGEIWHTLSAPIGIGQPVRCSIDWERRRDHMEQHGGEHLLAGALWKHFKATTIGLHLGKDDSTIDVSFPDGRKHMAEDEIALLEAQVNAWIRLDAPVKCYFTDKEALSGIPLRKPPTVDSNIRIVQYGDFEYCACGGTHPPRSGMIGQIKILSALPSKGKVRFSFVCGERAEKLLRSSYRVLKKLSDTLSCHWAETGDAVAHLRDRNEELQRDLEARNALIARFAADSAEKAPLLLNNGMKVAVISLPFADKKFLTRFAAEESEKTGLTVLCTLKEEEGESFFCMCRPDSEPTDLRHIIARLNARGGGRPNMVQGTLATDSLRLRLEEAFGRVCT